MTDRRSWHGHVENDDLGAGDEGARDPERLPRDPPVVTEPDREPEPSPPLVPGQIYGALRAVPGSHFADDVGPVLPLGITYGWGLGQYRADPDACLHQLDTIATAGYEFVRTWFSLGWYPYWRGHEVAPIAFTGQDDVRVEAWPDYDDMVAGYCRALDERALRLFWSCGDLQMFDRNEAQLTTWAQTVGQVIAVAAPGVMIFADVNEAWQNWLYDSEPDDPADLDRLVIDPLVDAYALPCLRLRSAYSEEIVDLDRWGRPPLWQKHGHRGHFEQDHVSAIRHARGITYDEGHGRPVSRLGVESEPGGPSRDLIGADVMGPIETPEALCLLAVANFMAPAAFVFHTHRGVRSWLGPIADEPGFEVVPNVRRHLPDDLQSAFRLIVHGNRDESPLTDADGFPEAADRRIDSVVAADDGRFVTLVYSLARHTRLRAVRALSCRIIVPDTGEYDDVTMTANAELDLEYACGRLIIGRLDD